MKWGIWLRRSRWESQMDAELQFHIESQIREYMSQGLSPQEAERRARREFGAPELAKDECRDAMPLQWLDQLRQDLRLAIRSLRKSPGFAFAAISTLALGIGANTAMFSVINGVLLKPLPYSDPGRLVRIWKHDLRSMQPGSDQSEVSPGEFLDWQAQSRTLAKLSAFTLYDVALSGDGEPEQIAAAGVSPNIFGLLGVHPASGGGFLPPGVEPDRSGVIISDSLRQRRFGSDLNVVGRTLVLAGYPVTVIGVMPRGFSFPAGAEVWRPLTLSNTRDAMFLQVVARMAAGRTLAEVRSEMDVLGSRQPNMKPGIGWGTNVIPLHQQEVGRDQQALLVLFAVVGLVLLIACANLANLLSARVSARAHEIAMRAALGAARLRLIRQFLTESVLLSLLGGGAGFIVASITTPVLLAFNPAGLTRSSITMTDWRVFLFAAVISTLTGLLFGLAPALQIRRLDLAGPLREAGRLGSAMADSRSRRSLVVAEMALALTVLTAAGLTMKSFLRVLAVDAGLQSAHLLTFEIRPPSATYSNERVRAFYPELIARLERVPGVVSAAATYLLPLGGDNRVYSFRAEGLPPGPYAANYRVVTPHYFRTMGIQQADGRDFSERDSRDSPPVLIVNQQLARRYWPIRPGPLDQRVIVRGQTPARSIVGVVGDVRHFSLESGAEPEMYVPHAQVPMSQMTIVIRTAGDPIGLVGAIKDQVRSIDPNLPVSKIRTMEEVLESTIAPRRLAVLLFSVFAGIALSLAAVGVYGVTAYSVGRQTREIGLRVALGATPRQILTLILGQQAKLQLAGIAIGTISIMGVGHVTVGMLFDVQPNDPLVVLAGTTALAIVALIASYMPARRALRIDPMAALRSE